MLDKFAIFVNNAHSQLKVFFHHNVGIILTTNLLFEYILLSTSHKMMLGNNKTTFKLKSKQLYVVMLLYQAMHRHVQQFFFQQKHWKIVRSVRTYIKYSNTNTI